MSQPSADQSSKSSPNLTPDLTSQDDSNFSLRLGAALVLILGAAAMRLIPHPPNFTPIAGMALFGAAIFKRRELGLLLPLIALFLSDCVLGFHNQIISVYVSFLLISMIGMFLRQDRRPSRLVLASIASSVLFFVVTNTAVWYSSAMYPHTFSGLMFCWTEGIPFFENTVLGDLVSTGALFGLWAMFERVLPAHAETATKSAVQI